MGTPREECARRSARARDLARRRGPLPDRAERRASIRGGVVGGALLRGGLLLRLRAGPLMFFWLACVWCLAHLLLDPAPRRPLAWWAAAGAMLGLGMLSKYPAALLVAGAGLYALGRPATRRWLAHPGPYLALVI